MSIYDINFNEVLIDFQKKYGNVFFDDLWFIHFSEIGYNDTDAQDVLDIMLKLKIVEYIGNDPNYLFDVYKII